MSIRGRLFKTGPLSVAFVLLTTILISISGENRLSALTLSDGLVGSWGFEDVAVDSSGNANTGVLLGSAGFGVGKTGRGLVLSGTSNSHVAVPSSSSLNMLSAQMTVSGWVKPVSSSGFTAVASRQFGSSYIDQFAFGVNNGVLQLVVSQLLHLVSLVPT